MRTFNHLIRGVAVSATLALALPSVAHAGMNDRAQAAIAEARGKISAGNIVGAGQETIALQARAKASLNQAEALLSKGKKAEAITAAQDASMLADQALAITATRKDTAATAAVGNAEAAAAAAQQSAAAATQQAAAANARADMAVAMATPAPVAAPVPAPVNDVIKTPQTTTTVTTEERVAVAPAPVVRKKTTHKARHSHARKPVAARPATKVTVETR